MSYRLAQTVGRHLPARADEPALSDAGHRVRTYAELEERTDRLASALAAAGARPGDRVAVLDKNSVETVEVAVAAAKVGAVVVPLNWRLAVGELQQVVDDAAPPVLVAHEEFDEVAGALRSPATVVRVTTDPDDSPYERLLAEHEPIAERHVGDDETVVLQLYTSGTTGRAKGVMLDNRNFALLTDVGGEWGIDESSVVLCPMPLFHIGGMGMALIGLATGCHTITLREVEPTSLLEILV